jgi:proteasome beta subunit
MAGTPPPSDGTAPARQQGWTPLHETDPALLGSIPEGEEDGVAETGTTVVGVTTDDAVVLAADRRASVGGGRFVSNKRVRKVEPIHPTAAAALSGAVGHIQHFTRVLTAESTLYDDRRGDPPSMTALSTLAGNVLRSAPLYVTPLLGGVDEEGPHLFGLDGGGGVLGDEYAAGGSGMQVAYGVLERQYESGLATEDAAAVAARAIESASERDTASGNGFTVATVTGDGVDVDEFDVLPEVDA